MKRFTAKIVDVLKQEKLYASQGGPIILSQVGFMYFVQFFLFPLSISTEIEVCPVTVSQHVPMIIRNHCYLNYCPFFELVYVYV